jgi:hypothetical protein
MATADELAQWIVDNQDKQGTPDFETVASSYKAKRAEMAQPTQPTQQPSRMYSGDVQSGLMTAAQGAGLGLMDELAGVGGAITGKVANLIGVGDNKTFMDDYRNTRDQYRGDVGKFSKENPKSALGLSVAGSLPTAVLAPVSSITKLGALHATMQAAKMGAGYGAVSGFGNAEGDAANIAKGTALGGVTGGVTGGLLQPVISWIGAVGSNIGQRFNQSSAETAAKIKLAEALQRDVRGNADPALQAAARMGKLGDESTIADSAGKSTKSLLDIIATLPGDTKNKIETLIHQRQAGRASRMIGAADEALGANGQNANTLVKDLIESRSKAAAPLYDAVRNAPVTIDAELKGLIDATAPFHGEVQRLAVMRGTPLKLSEAQIGDQIPLSHLDILKQSLFDVADAAKRSGANTLSRDAQNLRVRLTSKLDDASPKDKAGQSIYKLARDNFAGHSELVGAVENGKKALFESADNIKDMVSGMSASELQAFKIGAMQSIKEKLGSESGQTQMMKMWKEPKTSERLQQIFGNDYREFAAAVAKEARLKGLESVGRGSQTAERQYAAGDLDQLPVGEIGSAIASAKTGNLLGLANSVGSAWNRVQMPENTRNALGQLLMTKGQAGQSQINSLDAMIKNMAKKQQSRAGSIGAELGYQTNRK